jgi:hypothetical protein
MMKEIGSSLAAMLMRSVGWTAFAHPPLVAGRLEVT